MTFTVDLDDIWRECGYSKKQDAVEALKRNFAEGVDWIAYGERKRRGRGGHNRIPYMLTPECAIGLRKNAKTAFAHNENVTMLAETPPQLLAMQARRQLTGAQLAVLALSALQEENAHLLDENGQLRVALEEAQPKLEVYHAAMDAQNNQTVARVAKAIGWGPIKFFKRLRDDRVLRKDNTPFQSHIDAGRFRVVVRPIQKGPSTENYAQTFVTAKGLDWLAATYGGGMRDRA